MTTPNGGWFAGGSSTYGGGYNTGNYPPTTPSGNSGGGGAGGGGGGGGSGSGGGSSGRQAWTPGGGSGGRQTWTPGGGGGGGGGGHPTNGYSNFEITVPVTPGRWSSHPGAPAPGSPMTPSSNTGEPHLLLISLAESYLEAAHANGGRAAASRGADEKAYYKLIATGLRCLEAALQCRLQPRMEAMVRLRYAGILHEETENGDEAESALNKGIMLAQRNSLMDLKYGMHHLLSQIMFRTTPKASLKMLTTCITESETLDLPHWAYSFRFLRCSVLTADSPIQDTLGALTTLQKISNTSAARRDYSVFALSNLMEAMLSILSGADGVEAAQRALARANSMQTSDDNLAQLGVLRQILDIICSLMLGRNAESEGKMKVLHTMLDNKERWASWSANGEFEVPVNPSRPGRPAEKLRFRWLTKDDVFIMGYFISGLCKFQKNVDEGGKSEKFFQEGLRSIDRLLSMPASSTSSLVASTNKTLWRQTLRCYIQLYHTFLLCIRTEWDGAIKGLALLRAANSALPTPHPPLETLLLYLTATISQGTNSLPHALSLYDRISASLPPDSELSIISKLNSILILRTHDPRRAEALLASCERSCTASRNLLLKAAYTSVKATEKGELVKTKNYLSVALQLATQCANQQMTFIVLNFMCHRFFAGVVSEQAEKSAKAALQNAMKGRDGLWTLMGGEMYADCLARKGNEFDAMRQRHMNEDARNAVVANLMRHQRDVTGGASDFG